MESKNRKTIINIRAHSRHAGSTKASCEGGFGARESRDPGRVPIVYNPTHPKQNRKEKEPELYLYHVYCSRSFRADVRDILEEKAKRNLC